MAAASEVRFQAGGALPRDALYVTREEDSSLRRALTTQCALVVAWGPRQIGKSSMALRTVMQLEARGYRSVYVDLSAFRQLKSVSELYHALVHETCNQLLITCTGEASQSDGTSAHYFRRFMLDLPHPTVFAFDEVDALTSEQRSEFLSVIRAIVQHAQVPRVESQLFFFICSFLPPTELINDATLSPFNIGVHVRLRPFDKRRTAEVLRRCTRTPSNDTVEQVFTLTGGQPVLVQEAAILLNNYPSEQRALETMRSDSFGEFHRKHLELLVMKSITARTGTLKLARGGVLAPDELSALDRLGLVSRVGASARFANELYRRTFLSSLRPTEGHGLLKKLWSGEFDPRNAWPLLLAIAMLAVAIGALVTLMQIVGLLHLNYQKDDMERRVFDCREACKQSASPSDCWANCLLRAPTAKITP